MKAMRSWLAQLALHGSLQAVQNGGAFVAPVYGGRIIGISRWLRPSTTMCRRPGLIISCTSHRPINHSHRTDPFLVPAREASSTERKPASAQHELPEIEDDDLEEKFVRGSGPGGQKINKTASCVVLKHKPSGITVRCQETRSQTKNRELARKILQRKLDEIVRGQESLAAQELSKARARKARRRRKSVKKHFKSRRDKALMED